MLDTSKKLGRAPCNITREVDDDYSKVILQRGRWRIVECKDSIQWIIQRRANLSCVKPRWRPKSYCTTRKALTRVWTEQSGAESDALHMLPKTFGGSSHGA